MNFRSLLFFSILYCFSCSTFAVQNFMVRPYIRQGSVDLQISPIGLGAEAKKQVYMPNPGTQSGVYLKYKYIGISFGSSVAPIESEQLLKGKTSYTDYQFHFAIKHFGFDLYWQQYQGFYLSSASPSEFPAQYPLYPDMKQSSIGGTLFYIKSPQDYSYEAAFNQSVAQRKSGGSLLLFFSVNQFKISNPEPFLPSDQQTAFGEVGTIRGVTLNTAGIMLGWGHLFTIGPLYLSGVIAAGPAYQHSSYSGTTASALSGSVSRATFRFSIGYNGRSFFMGSSFLIDSTQNLSEHMELIPSNKLSELFIGYRF